ncbi:MAG: GDP-mannose 4,6-dehydratase [Spirochaetales bacterium]|nr:GDP-mannose 4,6-dehydratase [Spirochaetales bacterium]
MKTALITGITGQDGSYLAEYLSKQGYKVYGIVRRSSTLNFERISHLMDEVELINADLLDQNSLMNALSVSKPDEIYNLAAQSFVPTSWGQPVLTGEFTALGVTRMLEAMKLVCPDSKFYQASSSEMFGKVQAVPQTEETPFYPRSPYGIAKLYGHWITINYRESYDLFACSGILFNHESPRRGLEFVTRKITYNVSRIKKGEIDSFDIGNLEAKRDWGFAGDYVKAMHLMLQQENPDDYVVSTGETHKVREFCELAFKAADIDLHWDGKGLDEVGIDKKTGKKVLYVNEKFYRPAEVDLLIGDPKKASTKLGWKPDCTFESLVEMMVKKDLER